MSNTGDTEDSPSQLTAWLAAIFPAYQATPTYASNEPCNTPSDDASPQLTQTYTGIFPTTSDLGATAKRMHDNKNIYTFYGLLDGLVLAYSMLRYFFDLQYTTEGSSFSKHALHEWISSPFGLIEAGLWFAMFILASAIANTYSASENSDEQATYQKWKLLRDGLKALRNAFRALLFIIKALEVLTSMSLRYALLPGGLILGLVAMTCRLYYRTMGDERQAKQTAQKQLIANTETWGSLVELKTLKDLESKTNTPEDLKAYANTFILIMDDSERDKNGMYFINHLGERTHVCPADKLPNLIDTLLPEPVQTLQTLPRLSKNPHENHLRNTYFIITRDPDPKNNGLHYVNEHGEQEHLYTYKEMPLFFKHAAARDGISLPTRRNSHPSEGTLKFTKHTPGEPVKIRPDTMQWRALFLNSPESLATFEQLFNEFLDYTKEHGVTQHRPSDKTHHIFNIDLNRLPAHLTAAFSGFANGAYLFMGLISLVPLSTPIMLFITGLSIFASLACILTSLHEEHGYQQLYDLSTQKVAITLAGKKLELKLAEYNETYSVRNTSTELKIKDEALTEAHKELITMFEEHRDLGLTTRSEAYLNGLRHGLTACSSIICGVFASSALSYLLFGAALPQLFILASAVLAVFVLLGYIAYVVDTYEEYNEKRIAHFDAQATDLGHFITYGKGQSLDNFFKPYRINNIAEFTPGLDLETNHQLSMMEIIRALFSGLLKGPKYLDLLLTTLDDPGPHENSWFLALGLAFSALFSFAWSGRAFAKSHGDFSKQKTEHPEATPHPHSNDPSSVASSPQHQHAKHLSHSSLYRLHHPHSIDEEEDNNDDNMHYAHADGLPSPLLDRSMFSPLQSYTPAHLTGRSRSACEFNSPKQHTTLGSNA